MTSFDTDKAPVIALRFRVKGVTHEKARTMPIPTGTPATATTPATAAPDSAWWTNFWNHMDEAFKEADQDINTDWYDAFFDFLRKAGMTVREFIATIDVLYEEAKKQFSAKSATRKAAYKLCERAKETLAKYPPPRSRI